MQLGEPCLLAQKYRLSPSEYFLGGFAVYSNLFCCELSHVYSIVSEIMEGAIMVAHHRFAHRKTLIEQNEGAAYHSAHDKTGRR